jgi:hypothetical protein
MTWWSKAVESNTNDSGVFGRQLHFGYTKGLRPHYRTPNSEHLFHFGDDGLVLLKESLALKGSSQDGVLMVKALKEASQSITKGGRHIVVTDHRNHTRIGDKFT